MYSKDQQQHLNQLTQRLLHNPDGFSEKEKAEALRQVINYHDWRYYVLSEPVATDFDYDKLFKDLKALEQQHPELVAPDSPTHRVARALTNEFEQVSHLVSMLSLDNSYNADDLNDFDRRVKELTGAGEVEYCVEPKFDGASMALVYEDDVLVRAATRGDGAVGEDITNNAKALASVPLRAAFSKYGIYKIEIRGEVIIRRDVFEKMNEERRAKGEKTFQNPRNTASGSLRLKDPNEAAARKLEAVLYHVSFAEDKEGRNLLAGKLGSHYHTIEILYDCGFKTPIHELKVCKNIGQVQDFIHQWDTTRLTFNIDTDGMVVKVNSLLQQQKCGSTAHHPRWAMAYKFQAKQAQSKLLDVEYQVGRTGAVTPVAKIQPVPLAGVTISSISLHNEDFITEKDIRLGDTVIVERAGEVIPYIAGVVPDLRTGHEHKIHFPRQCPSCGSDLIKPEEEAVWRCDNADCPAQAEERVVHFVSKDAMDIDGLGRAIIQDFIQRHYIKTVEDIYRLPYNEILELEGWGKKSVENLQQGIEDSKNRPLWRLLNALGIRHVGVTTSKDIAAHLKSVFDLKDYSLEDLTNIEGIGPKVAQSIHDFFAIEGNLHLLHVLKGFGVNTENRPEDATAKNNKLDGKTFLFTGTLQQFSRDRAKELVEENGGKLLSGVSANLNYLVVGEDAGSKLAKAKKIPSIQVITEEEFLKLII
ncbi:MAG TPA: NAD-dependent DNA ligase LigA [Chitinophagales bacterium]|nr:NAD-dependent DNA ligase LigA [Chitinophagales bacterium]